MEQRCQTFIDALHRLERDGDLEPLATLFGPDAQITNPHLKTPTSGTDGARRFWQDYRSAFGEINSEFLNTLDAEDVTALEWRSSGTLRPDGQPVEYGGVSMIEWSGDTIRRFATYFDPAKVHIRRYDDAMAMDAAQMAGRETPEHY